MKQKLLTFAILTAFIGSFLHTQPAHAQLSTFRTITFPVIGQVSYSDDFADPRSGHTHEGNDLMGKKMMPLVAAVDGTITLVNYPEETWGYSVTIKDADGYRYNYLHINNDTPGTDDGKGDGFFAYAPDVQVGNKVVKGQLIGYMGDSGNAETTSPHLHFEIRTPDGTAFSPYQSLKAATKITTPVTAYPPQEDETLPYGDFKGGLSIASGNFDGDSSVEFVTGAGPGGGPLVRTFDSDGKPLNTWYAYADSFRGGVDVATGDIDGDGKAEVITAAGPGGGPHIRVFKADGTLLKEFFAYDPTFRGGVNVSAADLNNDDKAEIVTGPGAGGGPHIRVFKADGSLFKEFFAYDAGFHGGVDVAASGGSQPAIITAPGKGGGPHIKVWNPSGVVTKEFFAYDGSFNLGVRVSATVPSRSGDAAIAVMPATGGGPHLKTFTLDGTNVYSNLIGYEPWWRGSYDVAWNGSALYIASGIGRRASVRSVDTTQSNNNNRFFRNR